MKLKTLRDADVAGKTVLYRSPYDIGVKEGVGGEWELKDDSRISATLPTLEYLIEKQCKIIIITWVKRPEGRVDEGLRTTPHAKALSKLLGKEVAKLDDCVGDEVNSFIQNMGPGELVMLENTRFHTGEDTSDPEFAKKLVAGKDLVVFDGFPQAHREHASTTEILKLLPSVAGFYFEKEYESLTNLIEEPEKPFTIVIGGAKISDKVGAISSLLYKADYVLVGGGPANVFLKASGKDMGSSYVEDAFAVHAKAEHRDWTVLARGMLERASDKIIMPVDLMIADKEKGATDVREVQVVEGPELVPEGFMALDIGKNTISKFSEIISRSRTIFWNGTPGLFENDPFYHGTEAVAKLMAENTGTTIIAGGDTIEAAKKYCDTEKITHLSLAGGATLEFLSGKKLPVLTFLQK